MTCAAALHSAHRSNVQQARPQAFACLLTGDAGYNAGFSYDVLGRMTFYNESQGTGIVNIGYDDLGRRSFVNRLGSSTVYQYDAVSRLSLLSHHFANSADNLVQTFAYNPAGEVTSETKDDDAFAYTGIANASTAYVSNGLNELTAAATSMTPRTG